MFYLKLFKADLPIQVKYHLLKLKLGIKNDLDFSKYFGFKSIYPYWYKLKYSEYVSPKLAASLEKEAAENNKNPYDLFFMKGLKPAIEIYNTEAIVEYARIRYYIEGYYKVGMYIYMATKSALIVSTVYKALIEEAKSNISKYKIPDIFNYCKLQHTKASGFDTPINMKSVISFDIDGNKEVYECVVCGKRSLLSSSSVIPMKHRCMIEKFIDHTISKENFIKYLETNNIKYTKGKTL